VKRVRMAGPAYVRYNAELHVPFEGSRLLADAKDVPARARPMVAGLAQDGSGPRANRSHGHFLPTSLTSTDP
jgi:hypothetical protein